MSVLLHDAWGDRGPLSSEDLLRARGRVTRFLSETPCLRARRRPAWLKLENLQATGTFKVRGALNAVAIQCEQGDRRPVVTASAGNHAQGLAWAAREHGVAAQVVVPAQAPRAKLRGCRALGADVVVGGTSFEACWQEAQRLARERGAHLVHAFDDADVIAGQSTLAWELLRFQPDVVLAPVGGGGLAAGLGLVLRTHGIKLVGVQVEGLDGLVRALEGRPPLPSPLPASVADGLRVPGPGVLTTALCREVLDDLIVVSEAETRAAVVELAVEEKVVAEGAGAVAYAALAHVRATNPLAIVSGGNIDGSLLGALCRDLGCDEAA